MHRSHPSISRRKHLMKEMMEDDYALPTENQQIAKVVSSRGNNLHEVESAKTEENFLVSMPNKFRKSMWVKRGDFLLIEPIEEGDKVKAEICKILTPEHIKEFTKAGIWPDKFARKPVQEESSHRNLEDSDPEDDLPPNTNRPVHRGSSEEEEDEETSSDED
ncbi:probable RNA-binding protein EIF1AD [Drosophila ficusphila]|uniref:probable RNA-binding protein EIF1AD n=1 Tax=Drosophila ficusphila TaxID=30025 RepID=UPI0007E7C850|nr:probable RNA-binding protein EIF1AD [Drosophila ficusphila]